METIEYRTVNKSNWPRGEWDDEPDKKQWQDEETGLPCLIVRAPGGHLCGYVGVTEGHPCFGQEWNDDPTRSLEVHGGVTFGNRCANTDDESKHICHKPSPGEPDHVWWIGFDCAHCDDLTGMDYAKSYGVRHGYYRDLRYVTWECQSLARQLAALAKPAVTTDPT